MYSCTGLHGDKGLESQRGPDQTDVVLFPYRLVGFQLGKCQNTEARWNQKAKGGFLRLLYVQSRRDRMPFGHVPATCVVSKTTMWEIDVNRCHKVHRYDTPNSRVLTTSYGSDL